MKLEIIINNIPIKLEYYEKVYSINDCEDFFNYPIKDEHKKLDIINEEDFYFIPKKEDDIFKLLKKIISSKDENIINYGTFYGIGRRYGDEVFCSYKKILDIIKLLKKLKLDFKMFHFDYFDYNHRYAYDIFIFNKKIENIDISHSNLKRFEGIDIKIITHFTSFKRYCYLHYF